MRSAVSRRRRRLLIVECAAHLVSGIGSGSASPISAQIASILASCALPARFLPLWIRGGLRSLTLESRIFGDGCGVTRSPALMPDGDRVPLLRLALNVGRRFGRRASLGPRYMPLGCPRQGISAGGTINVLRGGGCRLTERRRDGPFPKQGRCRRRNPAPAFPAFRPPTLYPVGDATFSPTLRTEAHQ